MKVTILTYDTIDSTNSEALKQARLGAAEGLCIVARQQTAGRGRHGRTWVSESDAGLYFSIILRPKIDAKHVPLITLMAGIAVHDTLQDIGLKPDIKWVNDILVNEKKISGILAETTETTDGVAVIVGIGINLKSSNFPPEIADIATSIQASSAPYKARVDAFSGRGGSLLVEELTETLIKYLSYFYDLLTSENGPALIIDEWRRRSTYFSGKAVRITLENETITGVTDGLEPNGALRVQKTGGSVVFIQAGDVERLRAE
jgi:BirA family biotin operon repressor/biotin-[acetyl-CoA-carboxylase] ligase